MKAVPGRTYAQLLDARVHWIFTSAQLPEWNDEHTPVIDITDLSPKPLVGDFYANGMTFPDPGPKPSDFHILDQRTFTWVLLPQAKIDDFSEHALDFRDRLVRMSFEVCFNQENRIRVLEGKLPISRATYRDALLAIYKSLP